MSEYVLDASIVLAIINGEIGVDASFEAAVGGTISAVNVAEVASVLCDRGRTGELALDYVDRLRIRVRAFDAAQAVDAGAMRPLTRSAGLSFGDRACLALARALQLPVLTADRRWSEIDVGVEVRQIR